MTPRHIWTVGKLEELQTSRKEIDAEFRKNMTSIDQRMRHGLYNFAHGVLIQYDWVPTDDPRSSPEYAIYGRKQRNHGVAISYDPLQFGITYEATLVLTNIPRRNSSLNEVNIATSLRFHPKKLGEVLVQAEEIIDDVASRMGDYVERTLVEWNLKTTYQNKLNKALEKPVSEKTKQIRN
jgi:hypothetical protein